VKFCEENIPNYNRASHYKIINRALQKGSDKKQKLIKVEKLDIYEDEVEYINSLSINYQYKKLLFAFLVQMRLNKIVSEFKNGKEYKSIYFKGGKQKYQNIKSMANVSNRININDEFINKLSQGDNSLISSLHSGLISLNFLNGCKQTGDVAIEIKDYENVGWYFDYYNHVDKIRLCEYCGQPFKQQHGNERYCKKHKEYQRIENKEIICCDCHKTFKVNGIVKNKKRCEECQHKKQLEYQRNSMKEIRNK